MELLSAISGAKNTRLIESRWLTPEVNKSRVEVPLPLKAGSLQQYVLFGKRVFANSLIMNLIWGDPIQGQNTHKGDGEHTFTG